MLPLRGAAIALIVDPAPILHQAPEHAFHVPQVHLHPLEVRMNVTYVHPGLTNHPQVLPSASHVRLELL